MKPLPPDFPLAEIAALVPPRLIGSSMNPAEVKKMFRVLVDFLQANNLTTHTLLRPNEIPAEDFIIRAGDLTPQGLNLFRRGVEKWIGGIDRGKDPHDVTPLKLALKKIRQRNENEE